MRQPLGRRRSRMDPFGIGSGPLGGWVCGSLREYDLPAYTLDSILESTFLIERRNSMKPCRCLMVLTFVLLCLLTSCSEEIPRPAVDFFVKSTDGRRVSLSKLKGKVVVLNFWATWCPACRQEIPWFLEVYEKYRNQGLEIVGLSVDQGEESEVISFTHFNKISYPVSIASPDLVSEYGPRRHPNNIHC
jgi:thiol-disulfide isomerase/thioredoxin